MQLDSCYIKQSNKAKKLKLHHSNNHTWIRWKLSLVWVRSNCWLFVARNRTNQIVLYIYLSLLPLSAYRWSVIFNFGSVQLKSRFLLLLLLLSFICHCRSVIHRYYCYTILFYVDVIVCSTRGPSSLLSARPAPSTSAPLSHSLNRMMI